MRCLLWFRTRNAIMIVKEIKEHRTCLKGISKKMTREKIGWPNSTNPLMERPVSEPGHAARRDQISALHEIILHPLRNMRPTGFKERRTASLHPNNDCLTEAKPRCPAGISTIYQSTIKTDSTIKADCGNAARDINKHLHHTEVSRVS
jgi:hypothetical protein